MTIMINLLNFTLHETIENYHTKFIPTEAQDKNYTMDDIMETHYLELPKFRKLVKEGNIDLNDPKIRLILLFDEKTPQDLIEKVIEMDEFAKTIHEKATHLLQDQKEYLAYIRAEQAELDIKAQQKYATKKGREEGREEEKLEIATNLKNKGIPLEIISETTGITLSKVKKL